MQRVPSRMCGKLPPSLIFFCAAGPSAATFQGGCLCTDLWPGQAALATCSAHEDFSHVYPHLLVAPRCA